MFVPVASLSVTTNDPVPAAIMVIARPVPPAGAFPTGSVQSNVYELSFTSDSGVVRMRPGAASFSITLRSVSGNDPLPTMQYRPTSRSSWRPLRTRREGRDVFSSLAPGAGQYILVRGASSSGQPPGAWLLGGLVGLVGAVLLSVVLLVRHKGSQVT